MAEKKLKWRVSSGIDLTIEELPEGYSKEDVEIIQEEAE